MGPVQPPQRKGQLPQYAPNKIVELQEKFDELESQGIFQQFKLAQTSLSNQQSITLPKPANRWIP
jgi:hypothetical protein